MESQIKKSLAIGFVIILLLAGMCLTKVKSAEEKYIRVAVLQGVFETEISIRGRYEIWDADRNEIIDQARSLRDSRVVIREPGMMIGAKYYPSAHLRIATTKDITIFLKESSKRYRGTIDIVLKDKKLSVINFIELEQYVRGVLYHEITDRWPMEAMKAQAVATRTYALYQSYQNKNQPFDVTSDIYSQVYGGRSAEHYRTNLAVDHTRGLILMYDHKILPAYFHSNCGGHTENAMEVWEEDHWPPLRGVVCPFSNDAPHNWWKKNFRSKDVEEMLNAQGVKIGSIKEIRVAERNESGRIRALEITDRDGKTIQISGKKFRDIIGPNVVRSNNYQIEMKGWFFDLIGKGWGHGVGMCQWGAYEMARQQHKFEQILAYYYPSAEVLKFDPYEIK